MASIRKLPNGKWQAQHRPIPGGKQVTRTAARKADVEHWLREQTAAVVTGQYVDPAAGRMTFWAFYAGWSGRQVWENGTRRAMDLAVRSVTFGDVPLRSLRRAHLEAWIAVMRSQDRGHGSPTGLAPGTIRTRFNNVRAVLRAAVVDKRLPVDPARA